MAMKRLIYAVMVMGALLTSGCNKDEDMLTKQKDAIVRYLTSSRRLVAEEEVYIGLTSSWKFIGSSDFSSASMLQGNNNPHMSTEHRPRNS